MKARARYERSFPPFSKKNASGRKYYYPRPCQIYISLRVGRKAYNTRHLMQTATVPSQEGPFAAMSTPPASSPEWLTKEEMIERLRMSKRFFEGLIKRRKIPLRRYSRKMVRFNPVAVEAALRVYDVGVVR